MPSEMDPYKGDACPPSCGCCTSYCYMFLGLLIGSGIGIGLGYAGIGISNSTGNKSASWIWFGVLIAVILICCALLAYRTFIKMVVTRGQHQSMCAFLGGLVAAVACIALPIAFLVTQLILAT